LNKIEKYAQKNLLREIREIEQSERKNEFAELTIFEKAFIFKYSLDGFESLNEQLRLSKGQISSEFGKHLEKCLSKLKNFEGIVYRGANLSNSELDSYLKAVGSKAPIKEWTFISTSKSRLIAMEFRGNALFRIYSRSGKEIEKIAMHGIHGTQNEKEVLFRPNKLFSVLEIAKQSDYTLITLEEI
jgi:hypothetical protein